MNGFIATAADDSPTRSWQDPDKMKTVEEKLWCQLDEILNKIIVVKNFILIGNAKWIFIRKYQLKGFDDFKHNLSNSSVSEVSKMDVTTLYFKTVTRNCNSKIGNHKIHENENSFFLLL